MRMKVKCGDLDCREEFFVDSKDPVWECPSCSREIINKNYPFLTAKLMQAKIEGDMADWKNRFTELLEEATINIAERKGDKEIDINFLDEANANLSKDMPDNKWRELHDELLNRARILVLELDE